MAGHDVLYRDLAGVIFRGYAPEDDVPVGDDALEPAVGRADRQGSHVVPGQQPGGQGGALGGVDGDDVLVHHVAYLQKNHLTFLHSLDKK